MKCRADYLNVGNLQRSQLEEHISRNPGKRLDFFFPTVNAKNIQRKTLLRLYFFFSACFYYVFVYMAFFFLSI